LAAQAIASGWLAQLLAAEVRELRKRRHVKSRDDGMRAEIPRRSGAARRAEGWHDERRSVEVVGYLTRLFPHWKLLAATIEVIGDTFASKVWQQEDGSESVAASRRQEISVLRSVKSARRSGRMSTSS
jgi:hypothetical protein